MDEGDEGLEPSLEAEDGRLGPPEGMLLPGEVFREDEEDEELGGEEDGDGLELEDDDGEGRLGIPEGMPPLEEGLLGMFTGGNPGGGVIGAQPIIIAENKKIAKLRIGYFGL